MSNWGISSRFPRIGLFLLVSLGCSLIEFFDSRSKLSVRLESSFFSEVLNCSQIWFSDVSIFRFGYFVILFMLQVFLCLVLVFPQFACVLRLFSALLHFPPAIRIFTLLFLIDFCWNFVGISAKPWNLFSLILVIAGKISPILANLYCFIWPCAYSKSIFGI